MFILKKKKHFKEIDIILILHINRTDFKRTIRNPQTKNSELPSDGQEQIPLVRHLWKIWCCWIHWSYVNFEPRTWLKYNKIKMRQIGALTTYKKQFYGQQKKRFSVYHLAVICHYVQVLLPMLSSILEQHRVQKQFLIYKIPPNLTDGKKVFISMSYSTTGLKVSFMALSHSRPLRERR